MYVFEKSNLFRAELVIGISARNAAVEAHLDNGKATEKSPGEQLAVKGLLPKSICVQDVCC
jgi:hypothetical protein